ncbi:MAG: hypothetical protein GY841_19915, partial [FCB group bacterium]|nr:hypothetical protein [FCB group bacterium]
MKNSVIVLFVTAAVLMASIAMAEVPQMINFQGHMSDAGGQPLDTTVSMVFTIYDDSTGGIVKWTNTFPAVMVAGGAFSVNL